MAVAVLNPSCHRVLNIVLTVHSRSGVRAAALHVPRLER